RLGLPTLTQRFGHDIAPVIDALVIDRGLDRYRKGKRTLTAVLEHFAIEQDGRLHTADVDVSATLDVMRALAAKHPQLAASTLEELHREQTGWHLRWAEGMNQWLTKKGKPPDVSTAWPLVADAGSAVPDLLRSSRSRAHSSSLSGARSAVLRRPPASSARCAGPPGGPAAPPHRRTAAAAIRARART